MSLDLIHVNDLGTATLDDTDQIIVGEGNTFKKITYGDLRKAIAHKYGIVDLGTLNWQTTNPQLGIYWFNSGESDRIKMKRVANDEVIDASCIRYTAVSDSSGSGGRADGTMWWNNTSRYFGVCDVSQANKTAAQFKTAMSGTFLIYERT